MNGFTPNSTLRVWISSYKEPALTKLCLDSWLKYTDFPITIFDDFSTDEVRRAVLSMRSSRVHVLGNHSRQGHPACLLQARYEQEDYILFSDNDVEILAPVTLEMFPQGAGLAGIYCPEYIAKDGMYVVPRFHACFLFMNRALLDVPIVSSVKEEFVLPIGDKSLFFPTASTVYGWARVNGIKVEEINPELLKRMIHYGGQSRSDEMLAHPLWATDNEFKDGMRAAKELINKRILNGAPPFTVEEIRLFKSHGTGKRGIYFHGENAQYKCWEITTRPNTK